MSTTANTARLSLLILLLSLGLAACSTDDGPSDSSDSGTQSDTDSDAEMDTAPDDTREESYCNAETVCCNDEGQYVTSVLGCGRYVTCPDDLSRSCSEEAQCYDAENPKPDCVDDNGEPVEPTCFAFETISRWECPSGTADAGGDAGRDGGL